MGSGRNEPFEAFRVGNVGAPGDTWVEYAWPVSALLEQAFCMGWPSVDFQRGRHLYRVDFGLRQASHGAYAAEQVNQSTGCRRPVRRWASRWAQQQLAEAERQQVGGEELALTSMISRNGANMR